MIRVAIVGATGYTGCELLDILLGHPDAKVTSLTAKLDGEIPIKEEFSRFRRRTELVCKPLDVAEVCSEADLVFLSLPHGVSMRFAPSFCKEGKKVIDLSADFRFADPSIYEEWYERKHEAKGLLQEAVYGLPELNADKIKKADLVANPGCYPTGAILAIAPVFRDDLIDTGSIVIDAKSGVTGAGRKASLPLSFGEVNESLRAYKVGKHQHAPEIEMGLSMLGGKAVQILFVPHLVPMSRGILTTVYLKPLKKISDEELLQIYEEFYKKAPFVRIEKSGKLPDTKDVTGLNYCDISITFDRRTNRIVVVSAIDNLVKGAAGQAVQNMNLMFGFPETKGLV